MPGKAAGRAAVDLPWVCPNTDSLIGLAEAPGALATQPLADPAMLAFLLRFGYADSGPRSHAFTPDRFLSPVLPETAAAYLRLAPQGWLDPTSPVAAQLEAVAGTAAIFARRLAAHTQTVSPDAAAVVVRLAPLGWYAVASIDPVAAAACLVDPAFRLHPARTQTQLWGLDHDAIARRLATRWRLPTWIGAIVGMLNLPLRAARAAADPDLFAVAQLALREAEQRTTDLGLTHCAERREPLAQLQLDEEACAEALREPVEKPPLPLGSEHDPDPRRMPLLGNLLRAAAEVRRRGGAAIVARLEDRADELHRALADLARLSEERIRDAKLAALAELAAGAGHEINNPLAVISGNAQRLLRTEPDPDRGDALRVVVRNCQRIHGILRDLMQFARPPRPSPTCIQAVDLMTGVRDDLAAFAEERLVRFEIVFPPPDLMVEADGKQIRHAVAAVVRNAIEASGPDGWVRLGCEPMSSAVGFVIEDGGPGLAEDVAEHAFDPFYSGRSAGRGRGLGLPTAWRLARENGGELRYEPVAGSPTRFVVVVPRAASAGRLSA